VESAVLAVNKGKAKAEFLHFETNSAVCLRAVLRKEFVGTKSDKLLG